MKLEQITQVCCLGTGTMGFGTALFFAQNGYRVNMFGRSQASLDKGFASIKDALAVYKANGLATDADIDRTIGNINSMPNRFREKLLNILLSPYREMHNSEC